MFKMPKLFTPPAISDVVAQELYEAERALLTAQTSLEFAKASVEFQTARVERLRQAQKQ